MFGGKKVFILGLVIDINECRLTSAGLDGRLDEDDVETFVAESADYNAWLDVLVTRIKPYLRHSSVRCAGLGVTVPGLIDRNGVIELAPNIHMLDGRDVGADLQSRLNIPVLVIQEEYGLCLAEQNFGAAATVLILFWWILVPAWGWAPYVTIVMCAGHWGLAVNLGILR